MIREAGVSRIAVVDPADMHAGTMAPIAVASLAALVGVFVMLDSQAADRRLLLAGQRLRTLLATRFLLVLAATGVSVVVSLAVTATVFEPNQRDVYTAGIVLIAVAYALLGMLLGPVFGRVSSVFLGFLVPFLDLGIWQSPMLRGEPDAWAQWLPGYGGTRRVIDGALTSAFDEGSALATGLLWIAALMAITSLVLTPHTGRKILRRAT